MATQGVSDTERKTRSAILFGLIGIGLGVGLIAAKTGLYSLQSGVSELADGLPFGYAYGAGMVAAVNPCGILLIPSLVAYYLSAHDQDEQALLKRAGKAFVLGAMATLGFVALFGGVGLVFVAGGRALVSYFPIAGLLVGVLFTLAGAVMVTTGHSVGIASASRAMGLVHLGNDPRSLFVFGVAYGVASLACTLPIFLVVVGAALASGGLFEAFGQFVSYALGMGTMLTTVIVLAAFFRAAVTKSLKAVIPYMHRVAASLLLGAGIFIVFYWLEPSGLLK